MFAVKPIEDSDLHREICAVLKCDFAENSLAYFAAELSDDGSKVTDIIGICQFYLDEESKIVSLLPAAGREHDEAMIVMQRAVMSFMYRSGAKTVIMPFTSGPEELLRACTLSKHEDGYFADLEEFYKSPCSYKKSNENI